MVQLSNERDELEELVSLFLENFLLSLVRIMSSVFSHQCGSCKRRSFRRSLLYVVLKVVCSSDALIHDPFAARNSRWKRRART